MATLIDFRRRIRSVKNTQQITRAMKFIAAARLRRAQERVLASRPYAQQILRVLRSASKRMEQVAHPLLAVRPEERILLVVIAADRGLCGAFNTNVLRKAAEFLRANRERKVQVVAVGKRVSDALRRIRMPALAEMTNVTMNVKFSHAKELADLIIDLYVKAEVDAVYFVLNEFKNVMVQRVVTARLLPIPPEVVAAPQQESASQVAPGRELAEVDYIYQQPPQEIFEHLMPRYVEAEILRGLLESSAAEHAARMTAMDAATNNAADLIESLTLHMNKVRQAAITKEIIEVVSGAASAG
jgi:F-type H+-transporting ATPase subunit gamma